MIIDLPKDLFYKKSDDVYDLNRHKHYRRITYRLSTKTLSIFDNHALSHDYMDFICDDKLTLYTIIKAQLLTKRYMMDTELIEKIDKMIESITILKEINNL